MCYLRLKANYVSVTAHSHSRYLEGALLLL